MMDTPKFSPEIQSLLKDHDLNGLVAALRKPDQPDLRAQAARALGELGDIDATESLIRSVLEDPDANVRAAARQALTALHGNRAELVIASYRGGPPEIDEWLVEPEDEDLIPSGATGGALTEADIDGLLMVVSQESNPAIREKAIRALQHIHDTRSTDMLTFLALHGDHSSVRDAAREVLEALFGDQTAEILRAADAGSEEDEEWSEEEFDESESDDEDENDEDEDEADEDDLEQEDELEDEELEPVGGWGLRSPARHVNTGQAYPQGPSMSSQNQDHPVVQEVGVPWRMLILVGIILLILAVVIWVVL